MSVVEERSNAAVDDLIARARELAPLFEGEAQANDAAGFANDATVEALREGGFLRMVAPRDLGGFALGPRDVVRVLEALSEIDASIAWLTASSSVPGKLLHYLPEETARALHADGVPVLAGQLAPNGTAERVEGGYRVSGRWSYGSGIRHADYVCSAARVVDEKRVIGFVVPRAEARMDGNWDVLGLRPTGSVDYELTDVFVPEASTMSDFTSGTPQWGSEDAVGLSGWFTVAHAGWALGVGRRVLDEVAQLARRPRGNGVRLADDQSFKRAYTIAEAKFRSVRAWVLEGWDDVQATIDRGEPVTTRQLTLARTADIYLHDVLGEIAIFAFRTGGGVTLRDGTLQRAVRNALAGCQAIQVAHHMYDDCARDLLGDAEGMRWRVHELVPA